MLRSAIRGRWLLRELAVCTGILFLPSAAIADGVITIRNKNWPKGVQVEVSRGNNMDCAQNASLGTKTLQQGVTWPVACKGVDICYRRLALGFPNERWTGWIRNSCFGSGTEDI